jgi:hypothetical protein
MRAGLQEANLKTVAPPTTKAFGMVTVLFSCGAGFVVKFDSPPLGFATPNTVKSASDAATAELVVTLSPELKNLGLMVLSLLH